MPRPDATRLVDIIEAAIHVSAFLESANSFDDFVNDEKSQSSVLYQLIIIGEAVANLSAELTEKYPEVEWDDIRGFRNYVIHEYFGIALHIVWKAATVETPKVREQIELIFRVEFPDLLEFLPSSMD
jgi:uncharacterized protein with HEPN domain